MSLYLEVQSRPLERARAGLTVGGYFSDERPLRGGAGRADWRLCGLVSRLLADGELSGARGEAVLLPTFGRLRSPRLLLMGLGARADYDLAAFEALTRDVLVRAAALGVETVALAPLGIAGDDFERHAAAFLEGARAAEHAAAGGVPPVAILLPAAEAVRGARALEAAAEAEQVRDVTIALPSPRRSAGASSGVSPPVARP